MKCYEDYSETIKNNIKIVNHYGYRRQMPIWIEEMSELTKNICKWARKERGGKIEGDLLNELREEIADVVVCLDQMMYVLAYYEDAMMNRYKVKVNRQLSRIEKEKDNEYVKCDICGEEFLEEDLVDTEGMINGSVGLACEQCMEDCDIC